MKKIDYELFKSIITMLINAMFNGAAVRGDVDTVANLIAHDGISQGIIDSAIIGASRVGYVEIVRLLLADSRVNPGVKRNTPLYHAVVYNHPEIVGLLLKDDRVDPAHYNNEFICRASQYGYVEIVKLLLADPRVDPTMIANRSIIQAINRGHVEIVKLLLADGRIDPCCDNNKVLKVAARLGDPDIVGMILLDDRVCLDLGAMQVCAEEYISWHGVESLIDDVRKNDYNTLVKKINSHCTQV